MSNLIGMNPALALAMVKNYTDNHLQVINDSLSLAQLRTSVHGTLSPSDSRSVWFSLDDLNAFIQQIQDGVKSTCTGATGDLGIRIYFAQYPEAGNPLWNDPNVQSELSNQSKYAGMETVILVPTYNDANGNDVDFDPNISDGQGNPSSLGDIYSGPSASLPNKIGVMNHGNLMPPPFVISATGLAQIEDYMGATFMELADL